MLTVEELQIQTVKELHQIAKDMGLRGHWNMRKKELIKYIKKNSSYETDYEPNNHNRRNRENDTPPSPPIKSVPQTRRSRRRRVSRPKRRSSERRQRATNYEYKQQPQPTSRFHGTEDQQNVKCVVYTKEGCGYCKKAKELLDKHGITYKVVDVNNKNKSEIYKEIDGLTDCYRYFPVIFKNGKFIGGCTELQKLVESQLKAGSEHSRFTGQQLEKRGCVIM